MKEREDSIATDRAEEEIVEMVTGDDAVRRTAATTARRQQETGHGQ